MPHPHQCLQVAQSKKFQEKDSAKKLADFRSKLPKKLEENRQNLEWAFKEFVEVWSHALLIWVASFFPPYIPP